MKSKSSQSILAILVSVSCIITLTPLTAAQSDKELEEQIQDRSERIEELETEINEYESELEDTKEQQATLQEAVSSLDSSVQRISNKVSNTRSSIAATEAEITNLEQSISSIEQDMQESKEAIASTVRMIERTNGQTLVETLLSADSLAQAWGKIDQLEQIQRRVQTQLEDLRENKANLEAKQKAARQQRNELADLREQYADQRAIVESQKEEKAQLLQATNREASEYQSLLAEKRAQKEKFEAELRSFEEKLNSTASDAEVPQGDSQFIWPVTPVTITQQFGGTEFAKRNPSAYGRPFHNGTDFGVPVGTDVKAVTDGTVRATGNTDSVNGCYSYGKWVLVDHNNGLSTLYAHLSRISTQPGDTVAQGDRVGYSGNTGYSTGPHLHLTTYVQQDVQVVPLGEVKANTNCAAAKIPVAPLESYLNSMNYLP